MDNCNQIKPDISVALVVKSGLGHKVIIVCRNIAFNLYFPIIDVKLTFVEIHITSAYGK